MTYSKGRTFLKFAYVFTAASSAVLMALWQALPEDQSAVGNSGWGLVVAALFAAWKALENYRKHGGGGHPLWLWPWSVDDRPKAGPPPVPSSGPTCNGRPTAAMVFLCLGLAAIMAFIACGCATAGSFRDNERAQYVAACKIFAGAVNGMTQLRTAGKFSIEEADRATVIIGEGRRFLEEWGGSIAAGDSKPDAMDTFDAILARLDELKKG